jgi:hypothetical protein
MFRRADYMEVTTMTNPNGLVTRRTAFPRILAGVILCGALALAAVPAGAAPIGWNAFGGWYTDPSEFLAGAGARIGFGSITFNPNAEYIFAENAKKYTLNLDGTISIMPLGVGSLYAGGGLSWLTLDPDNGDSNTDTGFNVLAGFGLNAVAFKPYGQVKMLFINDDTPFSFMFGVRF